MLHVFIVLVKSIRKRTNQAYDLDLYGDNLLKGEKANNNNNNNKRRVFSMTHNLIGRLLIINNRFLDYYLSLLPFMVRSFTIHKVPFFVHRSRFIINLSYGNRYHYCVVCKI